MIWKHYKRNIEENQSLRLGVIQHDLQACNFGQNSFAHNGTFQRWIIISCYLNIDAFLLIFNKLALVALILRRSDLRVVINSHIGLFWAKLQLNVRCCRTGQRDSFSLLKPSGMGWSEWGEGAESGWASLDELMCFWRTFVGMCGICASQAMLYS